MKFKEIRLYPSEFTLDVFISKNPFKLKDILRKRYGATDDFILSLKPNLAIRINSDKDSEMKGLVCFMLFLEDNKPSLVGHELIHTLWQFADLTGAEMNYHSQEWQAMFIEYVTNEIMNDKNYTKKS